MQRSLRINSTHTQHTAGVAHASVVTDRVLHVDDDKRIAASVDRLYQAKNILKSKRDAYKLEAEELEASIKELTTEVKSWAEEHGKTKVLGNSAVVEFSSDISRSIDPAKFLLYLKSLGKAGEFWKFVKVGLGEATKYYGEAVLEGVGVLKIETSLYGNMKVRPKKTPN